MPHLALWMWACGFIVHYTIQPIYAELVNITLDDSSLSFSYQPSGSWQAGSTSCGSSCLDLNGPTAFNGTWHVTPSKNIPQPLSSLSSSSSSPSSRTAGVTPPVDTPPPSTSTSSTAAAQTSPDDHDHDPDDQPVSKKGARRRAAKRDNTSALASGSSPTIQLNFTGSAIYIYCIEPNYGDAAATAQPMNVTFGVDGKKTDQFLHNSSSSTPDEFTFNVLAFAQSNLQDGPHALQIAVAPNSVFMFDYAVYTQNTSSTPTSSTPTSSAPGVDRTAAAPSSSTSSRNTNNHDIASFGGAVGGSLGVLTLIALYLFISIYTRRRRAAKRERVERSRSHLERDSDGSSFHTFGDNDSDGESMTGPAPLFVPRYFPGTIPASPPPYIPPAALPPPFSPASPPTATTDPVSTDPPIAAPVPTIPALASALTITLPAEQHSYADRPPPTPPLVPPELDSGIDAPPSFTEALADALPTVSLPTPVILAPHPLSDGPSSDPLLVSPPGPSSGSRGVGLGTADVQPVVRSRSPSPAPSDPLIHSQ